MKKCIITIILAVISIHFSSFGQVSGSKKEVKMVAKDDKKAGKGNIKLQENSKRKDKPLKNALNKGMNKGLKKGTDLYIRSTWSDIY